MRKLAHRSVSMTKTKALEEQHLTDFSPTLESSSQLLRPPQLQQHLFHDFGRRSCEKTAEKVLGHMIPELGVRRKDKYRKDLWQSNTGRLIGAMFVRCCRLVFLLVQRGDSAPELSGCVERFFHGGLM